MGEHGPFESERQASGTEAARAVYVAFDADPGPGKMAPHNLAMLTAACEEAGVELGAFDAGQLRWLSGWEPHVSVVIAGLIVRAHEAGKASATAGAETQWGLRLTVDSGEPIFDPYPSEEIARNMVATVQGVFDTVVICRELGPWKEAPDA